MSFLEINQITPSISQTIGMFVVINPFIHTQILLGIITVGNLGFGLEIHAVLD